MAVEGEEEEDVGGRDFLLEEDGLLKIWTFWSLNFFFKDENLALGGFFSFLSFFIHIIPCISTGYNSTEEIANEERNPSPKKVDYKM